MAEEGEVTIAGGLTMRLYPTPVLSAALLIATPLFAEELPKAGTFTMKSITTGSVRFATVGNGESHLDIWEQNGKVEGDGLLSNMKRRCFGVQETVKAVSETPHGYCVDRDADGDQVVYRTAEEKHSWTSMRGSGVAMLGTGKYTGIVASYVVACQYSGPDGDLTAECIGQGSYILP
jgi:hypothetical protein